MSLEIQLNIIIVYLLMLAEFISTGVSFKVGKVAYVSVAISIITLAIGGWTVYLSFVTGMAGFMPRPSEPEWELMMVLLTFPLIATTWVGMLAAGNIKR